MQKDAQTNTAPKVRLVFQDAYQRFKDSISPEDAQLFQSLSLKDVENAMRDLERRQSTSRTLRNLSRIMPFLDGLERYSKVVDTLCNGTPYLPYLWAPVKLIIELTSGYVTPFNQLIDAYKKIAQTLPRFDRLSQAFKDNTDFQHVLAIFYADLLEFHRRVYKFVRRRGWSFFFKSSWTRFETRFKGILEDLATHTELVDREATSIAVVDAREMRKDWLQKTEEQEAERFLSQANDVLKWLDVAKSEFEQDEGLSVLSELCHEHSCDWIFKNQKMLAWKRQGPSTAAIWLKGKPGSGKSVLCSSIVGTLKSETDLLVLYYFCNQASAEVGSCAILKALAAQILRKNMDLTPLIYDDCISKSLLPTSTVMKSVLQQLLAAVPSTRIVLDGLDELKPDVHKSLITEVLCLTGKNSSAKVLFSSRDITSISKLLFKKATIYLNEEQRSISGAIQGFVRFKVEQLREDVPDISTEDDSMSKLEKALVEKADGMFLWVILVVKTLETAYSVAEMLESVESLPEGLDEVYHRIFTKIENQLDDRGRDKTQRIFEWVAFGHRPLKSFEIQHGIAIRPGNECINDATKQSREVFNLCKPLLEDGPNNTIRFVHSSVKEYLMTHRPPFIGAVIPQFDITFACMSYLVSGLSLLDPNFPEEQRRVEVAKGFHWLQLYANDHWVDHLFEYIQAISRSGKVLIAELLLTQIVLLQKAYEKLAADTDPGAGEPERLDPLMKNQLKSVVHALQTGEDILQVTESISEMRKAVHRGRRKPHTADPEQQHNDTVFSRMLHTYNTIAQHLLSASPDSIPGLAPASLNHFKSVYGASAFTCRFRSCPRAVHGFSTAAELAEHESTGHVLKYTCTDISCEYNKLGFASARALKQHLVNFHPEFQARKVPVVPRPEVVVQLAPVAVQVDEDDDGRSDRSARSPSEAALVVDGLDFPPESVAVPGTYRKRPAPLEVEGNDGFALSTTNWH